MKKKVEISEKNIPIRKRKILQFEKGKYSK
jgi:hypothetical protein